MPDFPPEAIQRAAEVRLRQYDSEYSAAHLTWHDFEDDAREMLDACAEALGEHVAGKLAAHRDRYPDIPPHRLSAWRRYFGVAIQVASLAFLTEEDEKRIAARELAAGNFVACDLPEDHA